MVRAPLLLLVVVAATVDITAHARRLGEADATSWQIHSGSTNVVANEDGADHAECPVTCVAMRKKNDGSGFCAMIFSAQPVVRQSAPSRGGTTKRISRCT